MNHTSMMSETLAETLHGMTAHPSFQVPPKRRLLAGLTAGAIAMSVVLAAVTPARADNNRDLIRALAAIAVIGVIANEVSKDRDTKPVEHRRDDWRPHGHHPTYPRPYYPRPEHSLARIPSACAIEIDARDRRDVVVYTESCLRDHGIKDRLPGYCAREIRLYGRRDRVYPERCLRDAGFRFDSYHHRGDHERPD